MADGGPVRARLAVGVPVRNGEGYLEGALAALTAQDVDGLAVVVNDNASTDRTAEIARDVAAADPRVRYRRHEWNLGAMNSANEFQPRVSPLPFEPSDNIVLSVSCEAAGEPSGTGCEISVLLGGNLVVAAP